MINKMDELGISQAELARRIGVTPQAIHNVVRGKRVSYLIRRQIAKILNIPLENIFEEPS